MKKKLAAGVLSLSMILTPTIPAWAEEALDVQNASAVYTTGEGTGSEVTTPSEGETTTAVAKIGDTEYASLTEAVAAAEAGATVTLQSDVALDAPLVTDKDLTIDGQSQFKITASDSFSGSMLVDVAGGELILQNVSLDAKQKGRVIYANGTTLNLKNTSVTGGYTSSFVGGVYMTGSSHFTMDSGSTITGNQVGESYQNDGYCQYSADLWIGANANGMVNTINGTVGNLFVNANAYSANNKGGCEIAGGKVTNVYVEYGNGYGADLKFTGGEIENLYVATGKTDGDAVKISNPTPAADKVYTGGLVENTDYYVITFMDNGTVVATQNVYKDASAETVTPKKSGYTFKGWYTDEACTTAADFSQINTTTTVYAKWSKNSTSTGSVSQTEFTVTADKAEGGSLSVSQKEASAGTMITVSVTPAEGNKAGTVTVTDKSGNKVAVASVGTNKYTFTMPSSNVTVKAAFTKADGSSAVDNKDAIVMRIGSKTVNAYGKTITSDVAPLIVNDRTLVPIRIVTETLGGTANWNEAAQMVSLNINGKTVTMQIGVVLEKYGVAPIIIDSRTYVPIRFVAEELGATVDWNESTQEITITK